MAGFAILGVLLVFVPTLVHLLLCAWVLRDTINKRRSAVYSLIAVAAVFFFPLFGFILYLVFRNNNQSYF